MCVLMILGWGNQDICQGDPRGCKFGRDHNENCVQTSVCSLSRVWFGPQEGFH